MTLLRVRRRGFRADVRRGDEVWFYDFTGGEVLSVDSCCTPYRVERRSARYLWLRKVA